MFEFIKKLFSEKKTYVVATGPNTLDELLTQFDLPKKEKTPEENARHLCIQIAMYQWELDYLKDQPSQEYRGLQKWEDVDGNKFFDWVPCVIRPDVVYCNHGKN